jgi:hypothetical protein
MLSGLAERILMARRHLETGQSVIERQRNVISKKRDFGLDSSGAEQLLVQFENSQAMFEDDLARLLKEQQRTAR